MALTSPPVSKLPPVIFAAEVIVDVALISPPVRMLPTVMLPVALNVVAEITLAPEILPADPLVIILPPVTLPAALIRPPVNTLPPVTLAVTDTTAPK